MKKMIINLFSLLLIAGTISAQTGEKALKKAAKEMAKYTTDVKANAASYDKSIEMLEVAFQDAEVSGSSKAWSKKGAIFNKLANSEMTASLLTGDSPSHMDAALKAYSAYQKAIELGEGKSKLVKAALTGLMETENHLNNIGITAFSAKDYAAAYKNFDAGYKIYDILSSNKKKSRIDVDSVRDEHVFYTGIAAFYGEMKDNAVPYFEKNIASANPRALSYDALFQIFDESDNEKALGYLSEGRLKFPDDTNMLFTEINSYLKAGRLEELISKLKEAIKVAPENASVYLSLGNVYDQLQTKETEKGNSTKAKEYFDLAMDYYNQAFKKDEKNVNTLYSMGALYYNKAANMTTKINEFSNDFSPAGMKKYDAAKKEMDDTFILALPFFEQAIEIDPNDLNTLQALREIYARQDKLEESNKLKERMEKIQSGK